MSQNLSKNGKRTVMATRCGVGRVMYVHADGTLEPVVVRGLVPRADGVRSRIRSAGERRHQWVACSALATPSRCVVQPDEPGRAVDLVDLVEHLTGGGPRSSGTALAGP